jgi:hypothetical protein
VFALRDVLVFFRLFFEGNSCQPTIANANIGEEEFKRDIPKTRVIPEKKYFLMQYSLLLLFYKALDYLNI